MLKMWTVGFMLLFSANILAKDLGRFECSPSPDLPTYQLIRLDADQFSLRVYFPNGVASAPVHSGDVSVELLEWLSFKKKFVQSLGYRYDLKIPKKQCIREKNSDGLFYIHCFSKEPFTLNGVALDGVSFYASSKKVTAFGRVGAVYKEITDQETRVGVEFGMPTKTGTQWLDLAKTFAADECKISPQFWD